MEKIRWNFVIFIPITRVGYAPGARKCSDSHEIFAAFHAVLAQILLQGLYFLSNEEILPITHNMQEIFSYHIEKILGTASD